MRKLELCARGRPRSRYWQLCAGSQRPNRADLLAAVAYAVILFVLAFAIGGHP